MVKARIARIPPAAVHLFVSSGLLNANKLAVDSFNHPHTLILLQLWTSCVAFGVAEMWGFGHNGPCLSRASFYSNIVCFALPSFSWSIPFVFNLYTLGYLNPEMCVLFRLCTTVGVATGENFLQGGKTSTLQKLSLAATLLGAYLYASSNLAYNFTGYIFGGLYWLTFVTSQLHVKFIFGLTAHVKPACKSFYLNLCASVPFFFMALYFEGLPLLQLLKLSVPDTAKVACSCALGAVLSCTSGAVRDSFSATSFVALGNTTKLLTITISTVLFHTPSTLTMSFGLFLSITSSALYSPSVLFESVRKSISIPGRYCIVLLTVAGSLIAVAQYYSEPSMLMSTQNEPSVSWQAVRVSSRSSATDLPQPWEARVLEFEALLKKHCSYNKGPKTRAPLICGRLFAKRLTGSPISKLPKSWAVLFSGTKLKVLEPYVPLTAIIDKVPWNTRALNELTLLTEVKGNATKRKAGSGCDGIGPRLCDWGDNSSKSFISAWNTLVAHQNPPRAACSMKRFLLCDANGGGKHGVGSRLQVISRCLTKAYITDHIAILSMRNKDTKTGQLVQGTKEIFGALMPWSTCTLDDVDTASRQNPMNVLRWSPKECGGSCKRALIPEQFSDISLFRWKMIEFAYLMRPGTLLLKQMEAYMHKTEWTRPTVGIHVRRADKHVGGYFNNGQPDPYNMPEADFTPLASTLQSLFPYMPHPSMQHSKQKLSVFLATDDLTGMIDREMHSYDMFTYMPITKAPVREMFMYTKESASKVLLDILLLSEVDYLSVQGSSNVGMSALFIKLARDGLCSNFQLIDPDGGGGGLAGFKGDPLTGLTENQNMPSIFNLAREGWCDIRTRVGIQHTGRLSNRTIGTNPFAESKRRCAMFIDHDHIRRIQMTTTKDHFITAKCLHV